ncbi:DsbA family oxidoreductase [Pseudoruegeria sp. SK021]|uniref:DsbA family oxidoreductase n=1 Tax=Pseudoruegeria sp. SK021 TaxID=1933035 RepID=UPI000A221C42|nr:DsbA family oxidoreductase [Pseudoruegeria sp. SK021]OSP55476.1 polyketide biosynthesis protein [Pseudoruegeria sp. SK021]
MVKLDIFSDPICPWCYIGKTNLDRALAQQTDQPFEIEWHPFQLNPDMPREGMDRRDYLETKFGGKQNAVRVYAQIAEAAEAINLPIDFGAIKRTPNTLNAHRLIHWSYIEQCQDTVVDALFEAYFQQGLDIGDTDILADIADTAGIDAAAVRRLLATDEDIDEVLKRDAHAREMGINSVPTFIVDRQHAVPGAQPTDLWRQVMAQVIQAQAG